MSYLQPTQSRQLSHYQHNQPKCDCQFNTQPLSISYLPPTQSYKVSHTKTTPEYVFPLFNHDICPTHLIIVGVPPEPTQSIYAFQFLNICPTCDPSNIKGVRLTTTSTIIFVLVTCHNICMCYLPPTQS